MRLLGFLMWAWVVVSFATTIAYVAWRRVNTFSLRKEPMMMRTIWHVRVSEQRVSPYREALVERTFRFTDSRLALRCMLDAERAGFRTKVREVVKYD